VPLLLSPRVPFSDSITILKGWFKWNGRNFSRSARNISLTHGDGGPKLEADLQCADGSFRERQGVNLADRIENRNGTLVFREYLQAGLVGF